MKDATIKNNGKVTSYLLLTSVGLNTNIGRKLIFNRLKECGLIEDFITMSKRKVLIISNAMDFANDIIGDSFRAVGVVDIDLVNGRDKKPVLKDYYDFVYVGEARSLSELIDIIDDDVRSVIDNCVAKGFNYIGASAGAAIVGGNMMYLLGDFDKVTNDTLNRQKTRGLNLMEDTMIIPHYDEECLGNYIDYYKSNEDIDLKSVFVNIVNIDEEEYIEYII